MRGWTTRKRELGTAFRRLEFSVGVRADFAVEVDFFVLWGYPFHDRGSLEKTSAADARIAWSFGRGKGWCPVILLLGQGGGRRLARSRLIWS
jgi:hypothetical protein